MLCMWGAAEDAGKATDSDLVCALMASQMPFRYSSDLSHALVLTALSDCSQGDISEMGVRLAQEIVQFIQENNLTVDKLRSVTPSPSAHTAFG